MPRLAAAGHFRLGYNDEAVGRAAEGHVGAGREPRRVVAFVVKTHFGAGDLDIFEIGQRTAVAARAQQIEDMRATRCGLRLYFHGGLRRGGVGAIRLEVVAIDHGHFVGTGGGGDDAEPHAAIQVAAGIDPGTDQFK